MSSTLRQITREEAALLYELQVPFYFKSGHSGPSKYCRDLLMEWKVICSPNSYHLLQNFADDTFYIYEE